MMRSIRLDDKAAAKFGRRVLLPGTAEYAAHTGAKPLVPVSPEEPQEETPTGVTHEVTDDGWKVFKDGELFMEGKGDGLEAAIEKAESGAVDLSTLKVVELRALADERGVSHAGLKKAEIIEALES